MVNGYPVLPIGDAILAFNGIEISSLRDLSRTDPAFSRAISSPCPMPRRRAGGCSTPPCSSTGVFKITSTLATPLSSCTSPPPTAPDDVAYPRVIIEAAPGSSATIIEHHVQQGAKRRCAIPPRTSRSSATRDIEHYRVFATGARGDAHRYAGCAPGAAAAAADSSPSPWAAAWCAPRSMRSLHEPGASPRQLLAAGRPRGSPRRLREHRHARRAATPAAGRPPAPSRAAPVA